MHDDALDTDGIEAGDPIVQGDRALDRRQIVRAGGMALRVERAGMPFGPQSLDQLVVIDLFGDGAHEAGQVLDDGLVGPQTGLGCALKLCPTWRQTVDQYLAVAGPADRAVLHGEEGRQADRASRTSRRSRKARSYHAVSIW